MGGGTDFQSIIESLSAATTVVRFLLSADKALDKAELKLKLAELMVALADARTQTAEMQDVTYRLADQLAATQKKLAFGGAMQFEAPYYWNVIDGKRDGPFCATCWDGREKLAIHLYQMSPGHWQCHTCNKSVKDATFVNYQPPPPRRADW